MERLMKAMDRAEYETDDYAEVLQLCESMLASDPGDVDVLRVKCFALINQGQWKKAIACFRGADLGMKYEMTYCLYRVDNFDDALEEIKMFEKSGKASDPKESIRWHNLKAQVLYKKENYSESAEVYRGILKSEGNSADAEICANAIAAVALSEARGNELQKMVESVESVTKASSNDEEDDGGRYELTFNIGTAYLYSGNLELARKYIEKANTACLSMCRQDGFSEDETKDERSIIVVQHAFVMQLLGKKNEAQSAYAGVLKSKPSNRSVAAVAMNNIISLNEDANGIFDSFKKVKSAMACERKLVSRQRDAVTYNYCVLLLKMGKLNDCKAAIARMRKSQKTRRDPKSSVDENGRISVLEAALLVKLGKSAEAEKLLEAFETSIENDAQMSVNVALAVVQLKLIRGDHAEAVSRLRAISSLVHRPGVVGTLLAVLSVADGDVSKSRANSSSAIGAAIKHWETIVEDDEENNVAAKALVALVEMRASRALEDEDWKTAAKTYETLTQSHTRIGRVALKLASKITKIGWYAALVTAYSHFDLDKAERLAGALSIDDKQMDIARRRAKARMQNDSVSVIIAAAAAASAERQSSSTRTDTIKKRRSVDSAKAAAALLRKKVRVMKRRRRKREAYLAKLRAAAVADAVKEGKDASSVSLPPHPDPDRWIKKHLRESFKRLTRGGGRRGRGTKFAAGAQGAGDAAKKEAHKFDAAARAARGESLNSEKSTASRKAASGKGRRRRKKKGRRR